MHSEYKTNNQIIFQRKIAKLMLREDLYIQQDFYIVMVYKKQEVNF